MSNLLEKASIITTPTAYSDGVLHSVKPEQTLGSELVANGSFDTSIPLGTTGSGWIFSDSSREGSSGEYYQGGVKITRTTNLSRLRPTVGLTSSISFFPLETRNYVISYDLISTTDSSKAVSMSAGGQSVQLPGTVGSHTVYFKSGGTNNICQFSPGSNTDIVLDNISIKEAIDADFTFTRNDAGTRVNASGNIESVGVDLPRIDYRGGCGSLLLEPEATNTATDSNDFTTGDLFVLSSLPGVDNGILTSAQATSPDGTNNAWELADNNDGNTGVVSLRYFSTKVISENYNTVSLFVKKQGDNDWFYISLAGYDFTAQSTYFNISNGTLGNVGADVTASIDDYGNGWYRISVTFQTTTDVQGAIQFRLATINDVGAITRDGTNGVYIYGLQAESHATRQYATSYIPTSGSPETRGADIALDAGSSDLISSTEGVFYLEVAGLTSINNFQSITLSNGGITERIRFMLSNIENRISVELDTGNGSGFFRSVILSDVTAFNKIAIKYKQDDYAIWVNGVREFIIPSAAVPTLNELNFTSGGDAGNPFIGNVKCVAVFKEALTDTELTALTS